MERTPVYDLEQKISKVMCCFYQGGQIKTKDAEAIVRMGLTFGRTPACRQAGFHHEVTWALKTKNAAKAAFTYFKPTAFASEFATLLL